MVIAGLYANVALKVIYINIVEDVFKGPRFMTSKGWFIWIGRRLSQWSWLYIDVCN